MGNYMGVSKNRRTPKWMVKIMENPIKNHDLGGPPLFLETPIYIYIYLDLPNDAKFLLFQKLLLF